MSIEDLIELINTAAEACIKLVELERKMVVWTYKGPAVFVWDGKFVLSQNGRDRQYETVEDAITALPNIIREGIEEEETRHGKS